MLSFPITLEALSHPPPAAHSKRCLIKELDVPSQAFDGNEDDRYSIHRGNKSIQEEHIWMRATDGRKLGGHRFGVN